MRLTSLLLALLLAGGLYWWFAVRGPAGDVVTTATQAAAEPDPVVEVVVLDSRAEPVVNRLILRGRTVPNRRVAVTAETEGKVVSEPKHKGVNVGEGEVLCRIDPGSRPAQLREAEARLAEARIEAEAAERLSEKGFSAETTRLARQAALEAAKAQVELIELDIARLEMHAPFAGVLETDAAEVGTRLGVGETCATLIDPAQGLGLRLPTSTASRWASRRPRASSPARRSRARSRTSPAPPTPRRGPTRSRSRCPTTRALPPRSRSNCRRARPTAFRSRR